MTQNFIDYIRFEKRYSPLTAKAYKLELSHFENFIKTEFGIEVIEVNRRHLKSWLYCLAELDLKPKTINLKIAVLKSFFGYLYRKELIEVDPSLKFYTYKKTRMLPYFVDQEDLTRLLDELEFPSGFIGSRDKLTIEILYGTGLRVSELADLKDFHFSPYKHQIRVSGKGKKERILPLYQELSRQIEAYLAIKKEAYPGVEFLILGDKGGQITSRRIGEIVKKYLSLVTDVEKRSPHVLRHSFATHLINNGANLAAIQDLLGHETIATTQIYTHLDTRKLKADHQKGHPKK